MTISSGETQREAAALAGTLTTQDATPPQQAEQTVPLHVVQSMREELKSLKEKNEAFNNHLQMMQWQQQQTPRPTQSDPFQGVDPEESIKVKDAKNLVSDLSNRLTNELAELKFAAKNPDYKEVISKYLPKAAQDDPDLIKDIQGSQNPYLTAYLAAKASKAFREDYVSTYRTAPTTSVVGTPKADPEMEKMVSNAKQSGNLSSVGNSSNLNDKSTGEEFRRMSDEEFRAYKNKNRYSVPRR